MWCKNLFEKKDKKWQGTLEICKLSTTEASRYLRRNPIEDGAISGFSGQKSVPE